MEWGNKPSHATVSLTIQAHLIFKTAHGRFVINEELLLKILIASKVKYAEQRDRNVCKKLDFHQNSISQYIFKVSALFSNHVK
jgi:hypothetical protein